VNYRNSKRTMCSTTALVAFCIAASGGSLVPVVSRAQQTADEGGLENIVVTARKQSEFLLEAPVTITAFSAADIQDRDIKSIADIANYTPAVTFTNQGGSRVDRSSQTIIIRGMNPSSNQTASVFVDGAYIAGGFVEGIDDVDRVEVIKGPQSTAFGREAFAGAIDIVTKDPGNDFNGRVDLLAGIRNWYDARLMIEGPIVEDKLFVRISPRFYTRDGDYINTADPTTRLGDQSTRSVNATLLATPTDFLRVKYYGQYWENEDGPSAVGAFTPADYNCNAGAAPAGTFNFICGRLPTVSPSRLGQNVLVDQMFVNVAIHNSLGIMNNLFGDDLGLRQGGLKNEAYHQHLSIDIDIPALGATLTSLSGMDSNKMATITDLDLQNSNNIPNPDYPTVPNTYPTLNSLYLFEYLLQDRGTELRLQSDGKTRLRWLIGGNYEYTNTATSSSAILPAGPSNQIGGNPSRTNTYGVWGSLSYDVTKALTVSFEGRYQIDQVGAYLRGPLNGPITLQVQGTYKNFLPRAIVRYQFTPDLQAYASYSRGVNPGVFNTSFLSLPAAQVSYLESTFGASVVVKPEVLDNYEIGAKGQFWDNRAQVQVAAYHAIWSNQIVSQNLSVNQLNAQGQPTGNATTIGASTNIGETLLNGVETELAVKATQDLTLTAAGAIAASDIRDYYCAVCGSQTGNFLVQGKELSRYSKYSGTASAEYRRPFGSSTVLSWFTRADFTFKSGMWDSAANIAETQPQKIVNLKLGVESNRYRIEAFMNNAFNNKAYLTIENNVDVQEDPGAVRPRDINVLFPQLRTFGVRGTYNF